MKKRKRLCVYCDRPMRGPLHRRTFDHVHPRSEGGTLEADNVARACLTCNRDKAAWSLKEWLGILRREGDFRAGIVERFIRRREGA